MFDRAVNTLLRNLIFASENDEDQINLSLKMLRKRYYISHAKTLNIDLTISMNTKEVFCYTSHVLKLYTKKLSN